MMDVVANRNRVYQTAYHVIWCPKYRRDILKGPVATETAAMLDAICAEHGWPVISRAETIRRYIERSEHVTRRR
jgi:putative transposase